MREENFLHLWGYYHWRLLALKKIAVPRVLECMKKQIGQLIPVPILMRQIVHTWERTVTKIESQARRGQQDEAQRWKWTMYINLLLHAHLGLNINLTETNGEWGLASRETKINGLAAFGLPKLTAATHRYTHNTKLATIDSPHNSRVMPWCVKPRIVQCSTVGRR